jgi:hypothetical protein
MGQQRRIQMLSATLIGVMGACGMSVVVSPAVASAALATPGVKITGLVVEESTVPMSADTVSGPAAAFCPSGDVVVGGGAYEVNQGLGQDISTSIPNSSGSQWIAIFDDTGTVANTGVAVALCAASSSLLDYSVQNGGNVSIPAEGQVQDTIGCPAGTVSLSGGANVDTTEPYQALDASAPYGKHGWRVYMSSAGADGTDGGMRVVCAKKPLGWAQIASSYVVNPAETATSVQVSCPSGTKVLGGGPFNTSAEPEVTIGVSSSLSSLKGWSSTEDNASSYSESVDEWAVCAEAKKATS